MFQAGIIASAKVVRATLQDAASVAGLLITTEATVAEWPKKEFTERVRIGTNAYVLQGIGFPPAVYLFHAVKLSLFVLGWMLVCRFTPGLGTFANFTSWIFEPTAFQKAFLWASLVEVTGLGCMSGP